VGAAQQLTLKVLKAQCQAQEERYPGYRVDLATRLGTILHRVRQTSATGVKEKVADELEDFGNTLGRKTAAAQPRAEA
jgi:hypothetical protein